MVLKWVAAVAIRGRGMHRHDDPTTGVVTPEVLEAGLALAIENVESFLNGTRRNVVVPR